MSDNIQLPNSQITTASDDVNGVHFQRVKLALGSDGTHDGDVSVFNPMPVKLDAASLAALENISVTVENPANSGLTDTQLRAAPLNVTTQSVTQTLGKYSASVLLDTSGVWYFRWECSGSHASAEEFSVNVRASYLD